MSLYLLRFSLNVNNKILRSVIIDIPPRGGKMKAYRTTLGHKGSSDLVDITYYMYKHDVNSH